MKTPEEVAENLSIFLTISIHRSYRIAHRIRLNKTLSATGSSPRKGVIRSALRR